MRLTITLSFLTTFILSLILVPVIGTVTKKMGIIAHTNNRTIHKGIIPRTGGYAIYAAFLIGAMFFLKTDTQINSMLIGGFIVFMTGLIDDIHDISPKAKLFGQIIGALVVIVYGGISLKGFSPSFLPTQIANAIAIVITLGWIIGITNAINLIDGLDGLCAGICIIVLVTISLTSLHYGRTDISAFSLLLAGAVAGFLVYNFHPASIFMGDCGALFLGYMIAVISLLGFGYKSSSFFTLGAPIVVLAVPIIDTFVAIIRRKVHHKSFSEADRGHLHHQLMFSLNLGQTKSVLILYFVTILFSLCSYIYLYNKVAATILFVFLLVLFELFIELTNMIDRKYKPILTVINIFVKSDNLPKIKDTTPYKHIASKLNSKVTLCIMVVVVLVAGGLYIRTSSLSHKTSTKSSTVIKYTRDDNETELMSDIYTHLEDAISSKDEEKQGTDVGLYFASDYYSLTNKEVDEIGGTEFFYSKKKKDFESYAKNDYYKDANSYIENNTNTQEVTKYKVISYTESNKKLSGLEDYSYYDLVVTLIFNENNEIINNDTIETSITLVKMKKKYYVVSIERVDIEE